MGFWGRLLRLLDPSFTFMDGLAIVCLYVQCLSQIPRMHPVRDLGSIWRHQCVQGLTVLGTRRTCKIKQRIKEHCIHPLQVQEGFTEQMFKHELKGKEGLCPVVISGRIFQDGHSCKEVWHVL